MATPVSSTRSAGTAAAGGFSRRVLFALAVLAGVVAGFGLVAVIGAGFALSFSAISTVARASGISGGLAWLLPTAIDGAMSVAMVTAVAVRRMDRSTVYPWTVVLVNAACSVAGNALHAYEGSSLTLPHTVAMSVSAIPALNLALSVHLLVTLVDSLADVLNRCMGSSGQLRDTESAVPIDRQEQQHGLASRAGSPAPVPVCSKAVAAGAEPDNVMVKFTSSCQEVKKGGKDKQHEAAEPSPGRELRREAWRWAQQHRRPDGSLVSGEELARAFDRSARWGRLAKREGVAGEFD